MLSCRFFKNRNVPQSLTFPLSIYGAVRIMSPQGIRLPADTFINVQKQLMNMPKDQVMKKFMDLKGMCNCPKCPTYTSCAKSAMEGLFCGYGASFHCITDVKGCICAKCPVAKELGLGHAVFCQMGSEKSQRYDTLMKG